MRWMTGRRAAQYIFFETLPGFVMGIMVFIFIILMFQILRLTEFALVHGVALTTIMEVIGYICISLLPVLFPMSLLFAIIMTYSRLSQDSEIVAMKSVGLSVWTISAPALVLGVLVGVISAQTTFKIAPWGNRKFEVLYFNLGNTKAAATIKPGTFSEGFFDLVVYANEVDSDKGTLKNLFIYNERESQEPYAIIAKEGEIIPDPDQPGRRILLRLRDGDIHKAGENHLKAKFVSNDIQLNDPIHFEERTKSPQSFSLDEIIEKLKDTSLPEEERVNFTTEYHKRWAIPVLCVIFAIIGVGLGIQTNRRQQKAGGLVVCLAVIIVFWILYVTLEGLAREGKLNPLLAVWSPNVIFLLYGIRLLRKQAA